VRRSDEGAQSYDMAATAPHGFSTEMVGMRTQQPSDVRHLTTHGSPATRRPVMQITLRRDATAARFRGES